MSGGNWDYIQYRFTDIVEDIKSLINKNGKEKTLEEKKDENWRDPEWYIKYPEDKFHTKYSEKTIKQFEIAVKTIKDAQTYIHRMDYLLSGDDGEESFLERLKEELNEKRK